MAKAQCKFCKLENEGYCTKKNTTVKLNKRRKCDYYKLDIGKADAFVERKMFTSKPEVVLRPDDWWDRKERKVSVQTVKEEDLSIYSTTAGVATSMSRSNTEHPLTGDLSRFMQSTVEDSNE